MAEIMMCEPFELYNLLNQCSCVSRLAEINYLCLIDARETQDYRMSHIITAKNVKMDSEGMFLLPEAVEVDSMRHMVVYDSNTSCLQEQGRAVECAQALAKASLHPVHIVRGGFQRFSALYHFLRTEKIIYTIMELESLKIYPVEVLAGLLYMGDQKQGMDSSILKDLKISAFISMLQSDTQDRAPTIVNKLFLNCYKYFLVSFIEAGNQLMFCLLFSDTHINMGSKVLIVSRQGRSRCSAVTIAFLMHHLKYTLEQAWTHLLKCKSSMRPNRGFMQQLSEWELHKTGTKVNDIFEPHF
uniref:Serine/threonine/tyrosine interacting-like 1 n=1 Tax=Sparus aurata TaxID=8175 RepID=A0A671WF57_SPAAU